MIGKTINKIFCTLILASFAITNFASAAPRLTLPETVFNFGYCPQNSDVSHKFWLISTGDMPLKITKVIPGCSCTRAPLDKDELAMGDSTQLEIVFSTKTSLNRVSKSPTIQTNEGPPDKKIQIIANIVSHPDSTFPVVIQPYKLDLSQKTEKVIDRIEFAISNVSDQDIKVNFVAGATDYFKVELPRGIIKPGEMAKGELILNKDVLDQAFLKSFTIQVNDDAGTRFTVPVKRVLASGVIPASAGK